MAHSSQNIHLGINMRMRLKRFLVFGFEPGSAQGGLLDLDSTFDTLDDALAHLQAHASRKMEYQLLDTFTLKQYPWSH